MDEGGRHGGGLQQAGGQSFAAGNPCAPGRRRAERAGGRIYAVDLAPVRQSADAGQRRNHRANRTRTRAESRARPVRQIRRRLVLRSEAKPPPAARNSSARSHAVMVPAKIVKFPKLAPETLEPFRR